MPIALVRIGGEFLLSPFQVGDDGLVVNVD